MSPKVLILDDEPFIGVAVCRELRHHGFECVSVQESGAAFEVLHQGGVSVVISDYLMPHSTGVDFLERCAREHPTVSQILLTGHADAQIAAAAIRRTEVMRLILKPWAPEELLEAVREGAWNHALRADEEAARSQGA